MFMTQIFFLFLKFCNMCKICNRILQVNNLAKSKLQYDVKTQYRLISRKFWSTDVISPERSLNQPKATRVCIYPFDKPMKWLYFRSFVVSVLFACFHLKVIRKSLYLVCGFIGFVVVVVFLYKSWNR